MLNADPPVPPNSGSVAAPNMLPAELPPSDPNAGLAPNVDVVCGCAPNIDEVPLLAVVEVLPNKAPPKAVPPPTDGWPKVPLPVVVETLSPSFEVVSVVPAGLL